MVAQRPILGSISLERRWVAQSAAPGLALRKLLHDNRVTRSPLNLPIIAPNKRPRSSSGSEKKKRNDGLCSLVGRFRFPLSHILWRIFQHVPAAVTCPWVEDLECGSRFSGGIRGTFPTSQLQKTADEARLESL